MRWLIDGYNVMHAAGRMNRRFGPDGLSRARSRFLDDLAATLGPERSAATTIVFDASSLPLNQAPESSHKGLTVIYAIEDEDADSRIERLIARDSSPRSLTVVSTDRRIRRAAARRRAAAMPSDDYLEFLDLLRASRPAPARHATPSPDEDRRRLEGPPAEEVAAWVREFGDLEDDVGPVESPSPMVADWTDADLERVAREVEAEFRDVARIPARRSRQR